MKGISSEEKGLAKRDYEAGVYKLETFKAKDMLEKERYEQKTVIKKREQLAFEKALINEAQAYTREASKRLQAQQGERKTYRKSLAEIYQKMLELHPAVVNEQFKLQTYGMKQADRDDEEKLRQLEARLKMIGVKDTEEVKKKIEEKKKKVEERRKEDEERLKKAYPENFKLYFFRLIKTLNGKAPGKMSNAQVYKNSRRLPTTFIVAGTSKRCTIHEFGCPEEPCPFRTHNKKIVTTTNIAKR